MLIGYKHTNTGRYGPGDIEYRYMTCIWRAQNIGQALAVAYD